ncbi:MAG: hypothetical protein A3B68_02545 [Candidatus Melainabacteria bacterium RIFCSPHIGHO2_02_FULL_34_12]|nr:MAG: hypothetical protein A3B68_02545 [Candidatus Melainabacteria bacterium RIFCSPHIGHO2_02_FULL_34_12]
MLEFFQNLIETFMTLVLPSCFKILLVVLVAFFSKYLVNVAADNFLSRLRKTGRISSLKQIFYSTSSAIITAIAAIMILHELGLDVMPIIASAGLLSLAVSLGAQHIVKDVVNGFFILLEDQFGIGDTIKIGDITGVVENMNLRITSLKDTSGGIHIIPNGEIKQVSVLNYRK